MVIQYHQSWLVEFFHRFPHIDLTFQHTNSTFNPSSVAYREALGFLAALPVLWCVLSLLIFACYYTVQCCRNKSKKQKKTTCLKVFIGITIFLGVGALGAGFYGNEEANEGIETLVSALDDTDKTVANSIHTLSNLDELAVNISNRGVKTLKNVTDKITNKTVRKSIDQLIQKIKIQSASFRKDISSIKIDAEAVDLHAIRNEFHQIEFYRWLGTILLYCTFVVIFLFFLIGILKSSKCVLILACVTSLAFLIFIWSATGFYLGLSVAVGDFCIDPDSQVASFAAGTVDKDILEAYLKCTDTSKPFSQSIQNAQSAVAHAGEALNKTVALSLPFNISKEIKEPVQFLREELKYAVSNLTALNDVVNCEHIHNNYINGLNGMCIKSLVGMSFMLMMSGVIGLMVTLAVAFSSRAWPHFGKRRGYYPVDDTDPFLPRPPPYEGYGAVSDHASRDQASVYSASRRSL